jgi:arginyl-tRNA synthetase
VLVRNQLAELVATAVAAAQAAGDLPAFDVPPIEIGRPKDPKHGDFSSSVAMQSAKPARMAPLAIAQAIVKRLPSSELVEAAEVLPPGFINFRLSTRWLTSIVESVEAEGTRYGNVDLGRGRQCQVEFISANPTGPLHMGSARNAVLGDSVASVLEAAGWQVQREYYLNDAGTQMRTFVESLYRRYKQVYGEDAPLDPTHYQGEYMIDLAREVREKHGDRFLKMPEGQAIDELSDIGKDLVVAGIEASVERLGIHFDSWFSETSLYEDGTWDKVLTTLREAGQIAARDGAQWLLTTNFGADRDEVLIRSSGQPGYYASDVAYHFNKFVLRGFDRVVDVWAVDHQNQARRMPYLMKALGLDPSRLDILLYDLVRLYRDGKEVKLSKRSGDIITVDEVVEEVGKDAVRFLLLTRSNQAVIDFDLNLAVQQNDENPVYYAQYAHARMASILRTANERGFSAESWTNGDLDLLAHPSELTLLRKIAELSEAVEKAALQLAPHGLAFYLQDLAATFHAFYRDCRVVSSDPVDAELSRARLRLVAAAKSVFARVLTLLGVSAPESM